MNISASQIDAFTTDGLLIFPSLLSAACVASLRDEALVAGQVDAPERILEQNGEPNSIYITGKYPSLSAVIRLPQLVESAAQLLRGPVYLHQAKINPKVRFDGSFVAWHRDFTYWHHLDGMPRTDALTAAVLLDDVDTYNAPLLLVPGSHRSETGQLADPPVNEPGPASSPVGSWANAQQSGQSTILGELKYVVQPAEVVEPFTAFTGQRGSVIFFHSNLVHGSTHNMSPRHRYMLFITYNRVDNALQPVANPRPPFIANRNCAALQAATGGW